MTDQDPSQRPELRVEAAESWWQRWGVRLLPVLTFLAGLALGAGLLLAGQDASVVPSADDEPSAAPSTPSAVNGDTVVTLPGACEDAAENIAEATRLVDDVAAAVRDFQPEKLVGLLDQLEDLDTETRALSAECSRVDVSESPSPEPGE